MGGTGDSRPWLSQGAAGLTILRLLAGTRTGVALGVSNTGAVVGFCDGTACLWDPEDHLAPIDLNERASVPDGVRLQSATHINDSGLILCTGLSSQGRRAYLLTPYLAKASSICDVSDQVLLSFDAQAGIFGVELPCRGPQAIPQGRVPVSKLCQLVSFTALDCPGCMRLVDAPCGRGWKHEYWLVFEGPKTMKQGFVFPVRLTIFREQGEGAEPKTPKTTGQTASRVTKRRGRR